jgi:hypothetical protein
VTITVSNAALDAHAKHGDLIPAPGGSCDEGDSAVVGAIRGALGSNTPPDDPGGVLTAIAAGEDPGGSGDSTTTAAGAAQDGPGATDGPGGKQLPFTGLAIGTLLSIAVMLLFGGWLLRKLEGAPRTH